MEIRWRYISTAWQKHSQKQTLQFSRCFNPKWLQHESDLNPNKKLFKKKKKKGEPTVIWWLEGQRFHRLNQTQTQKLLVRKIQKKI